MPDDPADQQPPPQGAPGRPVGAHYRAFETLGSGAMGEVRRGESDTGEAVAIKLLHPAHTSRPGLVARFVNERSVLLDVSAPNVVRVRDLVVDGPTLAIVMDLVPGGDLRRRLVDGGPLPPLEAATFAVGVLRGLQAVHERGVVHRDLKPENVLLARAGDQVVPKIVDFGVSKLTAESSTGQTSIIGSPAYMAPEMLDQEPTPRSDLYAVGVMLYELLCGVTPFVTANPLAMMRQHAETQPGRPPQMPQALWDLVAQLLSKDPAARPESAGQVADRLVAVLPSLVGLPAATRLTSPPVAEPVGETLLRTGAGLRPPAGVVDPPAPRRRRTALMAAGALLVLSLIGGGTALALAGGNGSSGGGSSTAGEQSSEPTPSTSPDESPSPDPTPSDSGSPTPTPTPAPVDGVVPALTGLALADAVSALADLGLRYDVRDVPGNGASDGTVVATAPASGQPAGDVVTLDIARSVVRTYLADVPAVVGDLRPDVVTISGTEYAHALTSDLSSYCGADPVQYEYDLGRQSSRLEGVVGLSDVSDAGRALRVEVFGDGRLLDTKPIGLGIPQKLDVDVTGVLRLAIRAITTECGSGAASALALGDPTLTSILRRPAD